MDNDNKLIKSINEGYTKGGAWFYYFSISAVEKLHFVSWVNNIKNREKVQGLFHKFKKKSKDFKVPPPGDKFFFYW